MVLPAVALAVATLSVVVVLLVGAVRDGAFDPGRRTRHGIAAVAFGAGIAAWVLAGVAARTLPDPGAALAAERVTYVGIGTAVGGWVLVGLAAVDRPLRYAIPVLVVEPVAVGVAALADPFHGLFLSSATVTSTGVTTSPGPLWYLHSLSAYAALLLGSGLLLASARSRGRPGVLAVLAAVGLPLLANGAYVLGVLPLPELDPTPAALALAGVVVWRMRPSEEESVRNRPGRDGWTDRVR